MCSDIMASVAGCRLDFTQAALGGFFRAKIHDEEYPGLLPQQESMVSGVLYFDLAAESIDRLDLFEGKMYQRQEVEVISKNNRRIIAMTYVIKPQYSHLLSDEEWHFSEFLSAGKEKFKKSSCGFLQF